MVNVLLKLSDIILADEDGQYLVMTGYKPDGSYTTKQEVSSIYEGVALMEAFFGLRLFKWAKNAEERMAQECEQK